uniref:Uncharacterized protein n=1 Tax=Pyramimonas obovata TaxID=1411642 RepID=A0A7S0REB2_9CHLO|mmetsp:Transcript_31622/g.69099  ORF Transcript_31622/g.69099 Transcript_31622/m.69099 type:complete len:312 (+) Transcript_31622:163-1098(+)
MPYAQPPAYKPRPGTGTLESRNNGMPPRPMTAPSHHNPHQTYTRVRTPDPRITLPKDKPEEVPSGPPTKIRLRNLSTRLNDLQHHLEDEKVARREGWGAQLKKVEEQLARFEELEEEKHVILREEYTNVQKALAVETSTLGVVVERKQKEMKMMENTVTTELGAQKQSRKDIVSNLRTQIDDPLFRIQNELHSQKEAREEGEVRRTAVLKDELARLHEDSASLAGGRETTQSEVLIRLNAEAARLQASLDGLKRSREQSESSMKRMLGEMVSGLKIQIAEERMHRENMEETLMKLLEETVTKVEGSAIGAK